MCCASSRLQVNSLRSATWCSDLGSPPQQRTFFVASLPLQQTPNVAAQIKSPPDPFHTWQTASPYKMDKSRERVPMRVPRSPDPQGGVSQRHESFPVCTFEEGRRSSTDTRARNAPPTYQAEGTSFWQVGGGTKALLAAEVHKSPHMGYGESGDKSGERVPMRVPRSPDPQAGVSQRQGTFFGTPLPGASCCCILFGGGRAGRRGGLRQSSCTMMGQSRPLI
jgi:hypothetical protein